MKMGKNIFTTLILSFALSATAADNEDRDEINWHLVSRNLIQAIRSENEGLQRSAMCKIIHFSEKVKVSDAADDIIKIFKTHDDAGVRILAMVTLYTIDDFWTVHFIQKWLKFEENERMIKQGTRLVNAHYVEKSQPQAFKEIVYHENLAEVD